jgi:hypothetical protein
MHHFEKVREERGVLRKDNRKGELVQSILSTLKELSQR